MVRTPRGIITRGGDRWSFCSRHGRSWILPWRSAWSALPDGCAGGGGLLWWRRRCWRFVEILGDVGVAQVVNVEVVVVKIVGVYVQFYVSLGFLFGRTVWLLGREKKFWRIRVPAHFLWEVNRRVCEAVGGRRVTDGLVVCTCRLDKRRIHFHGGAVKVIWLVVVQWRSALSCFSGATRSRQTGQHGARCVTADAWSVPGTRFRDHRTVRQLHVGQNACASCKDPLPGKGRGAWKATLYRMTTTAVFCTLCLAKPQLNINTLYRNV